MIGYPLDSHITFDIDGTPIYDRAVSSAPLRKLIGQLFSDGVLPNPSTNLQVMAGTSGMTVRVQPGFGIVKGCLKLEETERVLEVQAASNNYDRIDTVVVRLNDESNARICDLYVRAGVPASQPVRPELTRSESVYEIGLADIFIPKNTSAIPQSRITDTRYESARCGIISSISKFDTTTLYNQIQNDLLGFKENEQQAFIDWFENLRYVLDGDVAGHLQNEIDETNEKIGETDISQIGDSVTDAISNLNSTIDNLEDFFKPVDVTDWFELPDMQFGTFKAIKSGFTITISGLIRIKQRIAFTLKASHGYKIVNGQGVNFQVNYNGWTHDSQVMVSPSFSGAYGIILDNAASPYQYINYRIPIFVEKI